MEYSFSALGVFLGSFLVPCFCDAEVIGGPESVLIPFVEFTDTSVEDAVTFIVQRCQELEKKAGRVGMKNANVVVVGDFSKRTVTMSLNDVTAYAALIAVAEVVDAILENQGEYWTFSRERIDSDSLGLRGGSALQKKLNGITIPMVEFAGTPLIDALNFIEERSKQLDMDSSGAPKGVSIVVKGQNSDKVSASLGDVSIAAAMEVVALVSGSSLKVKEHFVIYQLPR